MFQKIQLPNISDDDVEMVPLLSIDEDDNTQNDQLPKVLPILPLRNNVLFPGVVIPISVGREKSIKAIKKAYKDNKYIGVIAQRDIKIEEPEPNELFSVGCTARIIRMLTMPDGGNTVILQGIRRFTATTFTTTEPIIEAEVEYLHDVAMTDLQQEKAMMDNMKDMANRIIDLSPHIPNEAKIVLNNINNIKFLANFITSNLNIELGQKQQILEMSDANERIQLILKYLHQELQLQELKANIHNKTRTDIDKQQRDYFLNQQLRAIQEELGGDMYQEEINRLKEKAKEKKWSEAVAKNFDKELGKLQRINPAAAEYSVILNYLDLMVELPWNEITEDNFDLKRAKKILDEDHYGLDKIKDRILEYLAVLKLKGDMKSPILCFVGPPGVGKTSLGKSIARALDRKYVRVALGGLHDESEIRGHRKTYIGAMPGRIIQSLKKTQSSNPVFILDEIDKVGKDHRGDPSSALLEVLDPEQNTTFYDNYLEQEYDLSKVLFIATANNLGEIQPALRDRMEVIQLSGYSTEEKVEIAKKHLISKQREAHGLKASQVKLSDKVIQYLIQFYTYESGVRELDRVIASVMRNIAKCVATEEDYNISVSTEDIQRILGKPKYNHDKYSEHNPCGVAIGLAWTPMGGDILFIESTVSRGKGQLTITGNLGNVMKESFNTAFTYLQSRSETLGIPKEAFTEWNLHIHVPEGAIPKDGPSAGIAILSALTSLFTQRRIKPFTALSGEITLRGKVLPVGGIKEKILAAKRAGIKEIVLCKENEKDVEEVPADFIKGLKFFYVENMDEVLEHVLEKKPVKEAIQFK
ncbi:MAG TPA: endopeptidase La [Chitinophagales bacterium]|nr:endopeptidase La [Chitinophagales bacterium]HQO89360.1 endopeptidase La [Chitinophagales bacterium]